MCLHSLLKVELLDDSLLGLLLASIVACLHVTHLDHTCLLPDTYPHAGPYRCYALLKKEYELELLKTPPLDWTATNAQWKMAVEVRLLVLPACTIQACWTHGRTCAGRCAACSGPSLPFQNVGCTCM